MTSFDPIRVPYASTVGNGPLAGQTVNFDLNLTNFDWVAWHSYEWENWVVVDALLSAALYSVDIRGAWRPNTDYTAGNVVIDTQDGSVLIANDTHTSSNDINADILAGHWAPYSINDAFVQTDGDTMTGDLVMQSTDPGIQFDDTDSAYTWRIAQVLDAYTIARDDGVTMMLMNNDTRVSDLVLVPPDPTSLMSLARSDNRYYTKQSLDTGANARVLRAGDTMTGNLTISNDAPAVVFDETDNVDAWQMTQVGGILAFPLNGAPQVTFDHNDARFYNLQVSPFAEQSVINRMRGDFRYPRYMGDWVAGTYTINQIVSHNNATWIVTANPDTTEEPSNVATDWTALGGASTVHVGDTPPSNPLSGNQWYCTVEPVGMFVWYDDGDSAQWVQTNGSATATGASGTFTTDDGKTVTVVDGSITEIV